MFKQILLGLLTVSLGGALVYFSEPIMKAFGRWQWAERNLGGTRQAYQLIGTVIVILGFAIMFGLIEPGNSSEMPTLGESVLDNDG